MYIGLIFQRGDIVTGRLNERLRMVENKLTNLTLEELRTSTLLLNEYGKMVEETYDFVLNNRELIIDNFEDGSGVLDPEQEIIAAKEEMLLSIRIIDKAWFEYEKAKGLSITNSKTKININEILNLRHNVEHLKPTWTSSNNSIISITEDGQIKGLAIGKATITLLLNNIEENKPALEATLIIEVISRWFTDAGLTNEFTEAIPITSNITVYAKWEAVVIPI